MVVWEHKVWELSLEFWFRWFTHWIWTKVVHKLPIDCLTDNIVERLKVSLTKQCFDNRIYEGNTQNYDFNDLSFDGDERLITRRQLYRINGNIIFRLNNGSSVDI